jgi:hypothetical protein
MAAPKTSKKQSKGDLVRSFPSTMPAAEVIEKANAEGITLTKNFVFKARAGLRANQAAVFRDEELLANAKERLSRVLHPVVFLLVLATDAEANEPGLA